MLPWKVRRSFGFYASIFYDNVKDCAAQEHLDLGPLLGHAIAHELGHLLLGTHSHMGHSLMSASWTNKHLQTAERRALTFSSSETQRLQMAIMVRRQAALHGVENRESLAFAPSYGQGQEVYP